MQDMAQKAAGLRQAGLTYREIGAVLGVHATTAMRLVQQWQTEVPPLVIKGLDGKAYPQRKQGWPRPTRGRTERSL
jgi:transposase